MNQPAPAHDEGFTLMEMVIAVLIMAIAVVTIVGALTSMIQLSSEHRGHAVVEVGARSFGEAAQQQAQFTTKLTANVTSGATSLPVADTSLMPPPDNSAPDNFTYVSVDREVMRVTAKGANSLTVIRDVNSDGAVAHTASTPVVPILRCPTATQLTPAAGTYLVATGVTTVINTTSSPVEYWNGLNAFQSRAACLTAYKAICNSLGAVALAECGYGYFRATIDVTTPGDSRLRNVTTSTKIMLRTGSS